MAKTRINVRFDEELWARLQQHAGANELTATFVLEAAVSSYLSPANGEVRKTAAARARPAAKHPKVKAAVAAARGSRSPSLERGPRPVPKQASKRSK